MRTEGNPSQESQNSPNLAAFEGEKQPRSVQALRELRHGRRFPAGAAASAEHGRCQERPLAHSQPGHGADELKYLLNRSIRAGNATCTAWERAVWQGAGWTDGGGGWTNGHTDGGTDSPGWLDKHIPSATRPGHSQTPQPGVAATGEAAPVMQEGERGARPGCHGYPWDRWDPGPGHPPGHRDPQSRLPQRC